MKSRKRKEEKFPEKNVFVFLKGCFNKEEGHKKSRCEVGLLLENS